MKLKKIKTSNFRNLGNIQVIFNNKVNFIVGENNLGKSNIIDLLDIVFNKNSFSELDFFDDNKPINIEITLTLDEGEIGLFEDYFTYDGENDFETVTIRVFQETVDDNIEYYIYPSEDRVSRQRIRKSHFISYGSVRQPKRELNFLSKHGFLNYLIQKVVQNLKVELNLETEKYEPITNDINRFISKIDTFELFGIKANTNKEIIELLGRIIELQTEDNMEISNLSEGTQFINMIPIILLNKIAKIIEKREVGSVLDREGKRKLYVIISVDEPELHLHPHTQRYFINYLESILSGQNERFNELIKEIFNIDAIEGQLIIVTHSPFILSDDYTSIIRLYSSKNGCIQSLSGANIDVPSKLLTHMFRYSKEIKEAFYAKNIIVVEGVTEQGALRAILEKENIDADLNGVTLIDANGKDNIPAIIQMFNKFQIPIVGIMDRDENNPDIDAYKSIMEICFTELEEFEDDIVECVNLEGYIAYCEEKGLDIVKRTISICKKYEIKTNPINKKEYVETLKSLQSSTKEKIMNDLKYSFKKELKGNKNFITGFIISKHAYKTPNSIKSALSKLVSIDDI